LSQSAIFVTMVSLQITYNLHMNTYHLLLINDVKLLTYIMNGLYMKHGTLQAYKLGLLLTKDKCLMFTTYLLINVFFFMQRILM
jgi:hypothetical protein